MIRKGKYQQSSEAARCHSAQVNTRAQGGRTHLRCACTGRLRNPSSTWRARMIRARPRLLPPDHTTPPRSNGREPPSRSSGRREHLPIQATDRESASWRQGSERQCRRRVRRACEAWHRTRVRRRRPHPTAQRPPTGTRVGKQKSERVSLGFWTENPGSWAVRPMNRHRPRRAGPGLGARDLLM